MKLYMAPLEGITGYIYRNAQCEIFGGIDRYFSPFIDARLKRSLKSKELRDILLENNPGVELVPQIMSNNGEAFVKTIGQMQELGYTQFNLNLGCPSGTVVAKGRGSGFLSHPEALEHFFEEVFSLHDLKLSVKTRIGVENPDEMERLLLIFNRFPLTELIVHPRIQKDFYKNKPNREVFAWIVRESANPVCYNGDIFTFQDYEEFQREFPGVDRLMLGRGILKNPALARMIKGGKRASKEELREFHDRIYMRYRETLSGEKPVLYKMKEVWFYLIQSFEMHEKLSGELKKVQHLTEYEQMVRRIFAELECL
ncbi:MAG: tRNA-dihydrouridine synthase family protein [Hespellia sp.]|nr:tRNA-dihydrouridine synthase family protein [Hespellia sp.]